MAAGTTVHGAISCVRLEVRTCMRVRERMLAGLVASSLAFGCSQKTAPPNGSAAANTVTDSSGRDSDGVDRDGMDRGRTDRDGTDRGAESSPTSRGDDSPSNPSHAGSLPTASATGDESSLGPSVPLSSPAFPGDPVPPSIRRRPDPATATEQEACVYYFRTQLNRYLIECDGRDPVKEPYPFRLLDCPDLLFSHGSTLTPAQVIECGDVWAQVPCEQLDRYEWPDCGLPPSTLPLGSPCRFSRQCASNLCSTHAHPDQPECGTCVEYPKEGEACSDRICDVGLECQGTCQRPPEMGLGEGAPCHRIDQCLRPTTCLTYSEDVPSTCQPRPGVGEPCPARGGVCSGEAFCNDEGMCQADHQAGEACTSDVMCVSGTFCDTSLESPVCAPRRALGKSCRGGESWSSGTCADGGFCVCEEGSCVCLELLRIGDACGGKFQRCDTGSRCENGRCVAIGLQGLADGCPPL